jgi:hypothetical protein
MWRPRGESRLETARETRWSAIRSSISRGMRRWVAPGRQHSSIADRRGRLKGEQEGGARVVTDVVEVVAAPAAVGAAVGVVN